MDAVLFVKAWFGGAPRAAARVRQRNIVRRGDPTGAAIG